MGEYFINDIEIDRTRNVTKLDLMDAMFKQSETRNRLTAYPAEIKASSKKFVTKQASIVNEYMDITSMNYKLSRFKNNDIQVFWCRYSDARMYLVLQPRKENSKSKELTDSGITITADAAMHGLTRAVQYQIAG